MRVAVLMGGISREREVSLASGDGVASALERKGWDVARVVVDDEECGALARARAQVAFIALHGRFGEDGGVQRRCEALGLPYTGSGPEASFRALEKTVAKRWFAAVGVPTPPWRRIEPPLCAERAAALVREGPGFPCVVKPVSEGSSIGVSIVEGDAHETVKKLEGPIDLVFLDADKRGYIDYLEKLLPHIRPGGLILGHDMNGAMPDPRYIEAITTNPSLDSSFLLMENYGISFTVKKR